MTGIEDKPEPKYVPQRVALAKHFRAVCGSDDNGKSNAVPRFIGVFDTVAAIASYGSLAIVTGLIPGLILLSSGILAPFFSSFWFGFWYLTAAVAVFGLVAHAATHFKVAFGLEG